MNARVIVVVMLVSAVVIVVGGFSLLSSDSSTTTNDAVAVEENADVGEVAAPEKGPKRIVDEDKVARVRRGITGVDARRRGLFQPMNLVPARAAVSAARPADSQGLSVVFREAHPLLKACWETHSEMHPGAPTSFEVSFDVTSGETRRAIIGETTVVGAGSETVFLEQCIGEIVGDFHLASPPDGARSFSWPVTFEPTE